MDWNLGDLAIVFGTVAGVVTLLLYGTGHIA